MLSLHLTAKKKKTCFSFHVEHLPGRALVMVTVVNWTVVVIRTCNVNAIAMTHH